MQVKIDEEFEHDVHFFKIVNDCFEISGLKLQMRSVTGHSMGPARPARPAGPMEFLPYPLVALVGTSALHPSERLGLVNCFIWGESARVMNRDDLHSFAVCCVGNTDSF